jgi:hypothetical protein
VGQYNNFTVTIQKPFEVDNDNKLKVTEGDLNVTQNQQLEEPIDGDKQACLGAFIITERGEAIQKAALPKLQEITVIEDLAKFQEMFDQAMHHAMIQPVERPDEFDSECRQGNYGRQYADGL